MKNQKLDFIDYAKRHFKAIEFGDHKQANKLHDKLMAIYYRFKNHNEWDFFFDLINNDDNCVKYWAATFLLKKDEELAMNVLNDLSKIDGPISMLAYTSICIWQKGISKL